MCIANFRIFFALPLFFFFVTNCIKICDNQIVTVKKGMQSKIFLFSVFFLVYIFSLSVAKEHFGFGCAVADRSDTFDHFKSLEALTDNDLKQIIYEKTHGKAQMDRFPTRESLVEAVKHFEEKERKEQVIEKEVQTSLNSASSNISYTVKCLYCTG